MWELFLLLLGERVRPAGGPNAHEGVNELLACQSVLLQEQLDHALALLFDQFVSFAHNSVVFIDCLYDTAALRGLSAAKLIIFS